MWTVIKTVFLTAVFWGLAASLLALGFLIAWPTGQGVFGLGPHVLSLTQAFGVVGTVMILVATVRFAVVAPLLMHGPNGYGHNELQTIQWPPPPAPARVSQDVRVPDTINVKLPSSELRVHLTGR